MLKSLYEFGINHTDIVLPSGYAKRRICFSICLDSNGHLLGIERFEKNEMIVCPDKSSELTGKTSRANVLMEKASIAVLYQVDELPDNKQSLVREKHNSFKTEFANGIDDVPEFQFVYDLLSDNDKMEQVRDMCADAGVKSTDVLGFSVDGVLLSELKSVRPWWEKKKSQVAGNNNLLVLDVVTGELVEPVRISDKSVKGLSRTGGQASGSKLITFDKDSFCSYGLSQNYNCSMSDRTNGIIIDSLNYLISVAETVADTVFVHWYAESIDDKTEDPFAMLFDPDCGQDDNFVVNEDALNDVATELVRSPFTGNPPAGQLQNKYHILLLNGSGARIEFRSNLMIGSYEDLYRNVSLWFSDLSIASMRKPKGLYALLYPLLSVGEAKATPKNFSAIRPLMPNIIMACMSGQQIPVVLLERALRNIQTNIYNDDDTRYSDVVLSQWIKLWVLRNERIHGKEETIMIGLNENHPEPAYHCGRIMAAVASAQKTVNPNVGAGVLQSFYAGVCRAPALGLASLQSRMNHYLANIKSIALRRMYDDAMQSAARGIGDVIPKQLTLEQQAYFALGYQQQNADFARQNAERKSAYNIKNTEGDD